jgi:hypothetical protein
MFRALTTADNPSNAMASLSSASPNGSSRKLVLVDFDWQDADLVPELLQQPGISVRLVASERGDDAGIRLSELCGLPRTVDLDDLPRDIFDWHSSAGAVRAEPKSKAFCSHWAPQAFRRRPS